MQIASRASGVDVEVLRKQFLEHRRGADADNFFTINTKAYPGVINREYFCYKGGAFCTAARTSFMSGDKAGGYIDISTELYLSEIAFRI